MSTKIAILGGGAWGTALAAMACSSGHNTWLYARDDETVDAINRTHRNTRYLGEIVLPDAIHASTDAAAVVGGADAVLAVIPAQAMRAGLSQLSDLIAQRTPVVLCAKGIERSTGRLMSEVVAEVLPNHRIAALSGPSFATDVARGLPTAVTVACEDAPTADQLAALLSGPAFRCYSTTDLKGVEIGGALKNVLAIAAGAAVGRGYGASAQAALVTRGFAELRRIGQAMGARPETIMGLSGLGDLMLTCSSSQSRNYSYGLALGRGEDLTNRPLAEGVATAPIAAELCRKHAISAPIIDATGALLDGTITIDEAVTALLTRPLKTED
ncbi:MULTISPECIES: NAD(P)H-dependent glycerol-3-phosphate dehydrogenase [Brucella/Ochrobactrum group]|uniref:Glycerol-3-phosphate dehydrogenase [NAD(P)+] n=1 Tax=Brucella pseudintermedia TaxID=370111 RepID=A0ABY5U849_9HYPH|nr:MULTISPECIES: NAD(P)H-dependent glycerol-3-phosphate dehydrogenase [Brucella/Ochrobactrum group]KAB2681555.1 NAD(P)-dependent glycerol-3-phosphate dehydrogenase [Brucella pseudintermedia]MCO7726911.1 NAD(P)-dependent glycerol-3-phosphate dehydrogenase [Brucella intermedia]NKE76384.1 NAD(P)-dependent glycerol-3-phosphate dehydrogenase [Ochrobactrum sp. MC-1LL]TWG96167.1 glycerol-3-phosphate dehydrogenase (NAD(P)+) [Ochrobactrum sp. J50]UWL59510.1 NAD(P)-dependent glycerol-3-phosphate dehydro